MDETKKDKFIDKLEKNSSKFDFNLKLNLKFTEKMPTLEGLLKDFNTLVYAITFEGGKSAPFRVRQYADVIKILKNYPNSNLVDKDTIKNFLIQKGKKNSDNNG